MPLPFSRWRLLGGGFLLVAFSAFGQTFVLSLFGGEWRASFGLSHGELGLAYSVATLGSALLLIATGHLADRVAMPVMVAGVVLGAACGSLVLGSAAGVTSLVLGFFLLRFFGQGLMTHTAQTAVARSFHRHRGKAVSLVAAGFPVAEALVPALVVALMAAFGWRATWWLIAGLLLLLAGALPALLGRQDTEPPLPSPTSAEPASWNRAQVLRDRRFYLLLPAVVGAPFTVTALFFHQVPLAAAKGWTLAWLAASFPAFAAAHLAALTLSGPLVDRFGARRLLPWHLLPLGLALLALALTDGPWLAPLYLGLAGLSIGLANTLMGTIWVELYGNAHLGAIRALGQSAMIFSTALAPVLVGVALDAGWSMEQVALLLAAILVLISWLAWSGLRRGWRHRLS